MSVLIRIMTESEFKIFYEWSISQHAVELMEESALPYERARREAEEELAGMLPDGLRTKHNDLMTVVEEGSGEASGFIWTIHEYTNGRKQCFICDFAICELKRRRGYASATLQLVEKNALEAGCQEMVLFVADQNAAARALYNRCGYLPLRKERYGQYMIKQLL